MQVCPACSFCLPTLFLSWQPNAGMSVICFCGGIGSLRREDKAFPTDALLPRVSRRKLVRGSFSLYTSQIWSPQQKSQQRNLLAFNLRNWYLQHPVCLWISYWCNYQRTAEGCWLVVSVPSFHDFFLKNASCLFYAGHLLFFIHLFGSLPSDSLLLMVEGFQVIAAGPALWHMRQCESRLLRSLFASRSAITSTDHRRPTSWSRHQLWYSAIRYRVYTPLCIYLCSECVHVKQRLSKSPAGIVIDDYEDLDNISKPFPSLASIALFKRPKVSSVVLWVFSDLSSRAFGPQSAQGFSWVLRSANSFSWNEAAGHGAGELPDGSVRHAELSRLICGRYERKAYSRIKSISFPRRELDFREKNEEPNWTTH